MKWWMVTRLTVERGVAFGVICCYQSKCCLCIYINVYTLCLFCRYIFRLLVPGSGLHKLHSYVVVVAVRTNWIECVVHTLRYKQILHPSLLIWRFPNTMWMRVSECFLYLFGVYCIYISNHIDGSQRQYITWRKMYQYDNNNTQTQCRTPWHSHSLHFASV